MAQTPNDRVIFNAQNVYDYCRAFAVKQGWEDLRKFLSSRPPFDHVEMRWRSDGWPGTKGQEYYLRGDILTRKTLASNIMSDGEIEDLYGEVSSVSAKTYLNDPEARFIMFTLGIGHNHDLETYPGTIIVATRADGSVIVTNDDVAWIHLLGRQDAKKFMTFTEPQKQALKSIMHFGVTVGLATFNFLNCRNIEVVDDPPSRQVRRFCERTGSPLPPTIKTLRLKPTVKRRNGQSKPSESESMTALHIVRGHFKDYRQGNGMGRWQAHGLWWWSPQVRGQYDHGMVVKDYAVEVPTE